MSARKKISIIAGVLLLLPILGFSLWAMSPAGELYDSVDMSPNLDIVSNIEASYTTTSFEERLSQVGYDTFLAGDGPYTVFVPTDIAYGNLPADIKASFDDPKNTSFLREVLLYHVIKGKFDSSTFKDGMTFHTMQGDELVLERKDNYWTLNGYASIETTDIHTNNGTIHLITNYLIPERYLQQ